MICILHGYLLDGSGSNLWTQAILRTLCRAGETVHLMCQEPHPERFDYVARALRHDAQPGVEVLLEREVPYPGQCVVHKPTLGPVLPVYVWDKYEEFTRVVPMVELDDAGIEDYLARNEAVLARIVDQHPITALHANHAVLMSVVARRVAAARGLPFTIMPHGSAIEYAVKRDERFLRHASEAFAAAGRIFVIGPEIRQRVQAVFGDAVPGVENKLVDLNLGVDTGLFEPVEPGRRAASVARLREVLQGVERGKRPEQSRELRNRLGDGMGRAALRKALARGSDYTAKHTDADCEDKLERVAWGEEQLLLFVGRLIASKGIHGVVAAMPAILRRHPRARLLVVGHGPLREPLEALLWALDTGSRQLLDDIVGWGRHLEGAPEPEPFEHLRHFLDGLAAAGELDDYWETARRLHVSERVIFTGYLTHRELRHLFPCCDVAIFPSIVAEAGPLVFLEAMASGVFPMGIYFAGMGASIDSVAPAVPAEVLERMKLRQDPRHTVADIVDNVVAVLGGPGRAHAAALRRVAEERYDWTAVGRRFLETLGALGSGA